jgi:hypothetical protein
MSCLHVLASVTLRHQESLFKYDYCDSHSDMTTTFEPHQKYVGSTIPRRRSRALQISTCSSSTVVMAPTFLRDDIPALPKVYVDAINFFLLFADQFGSSSHSRDAASALKCIVSTQIIVSYKNYQILQAVPHKAPNHDQLFWYYRTWRSLLCV